MAWLERVDIDCVCGDLFSMPAEAIICNVNVHLNLNYSLGQQLAKRCGDDLVRDLEILKKALPEGRLELGDAVTTSAYHMEPVQKIILFAWWGPDNEFTPHLIYKSFVNCLRQAFSHQARSLTCPLFGTGSATMKLGDFAEQIARALTDLNGLKNAQEYSLEELSFVSKKINDIYFLSEFLRKKSFENVQFSR